MVCVPGLGLDARAWEPTLTALRDWRAEVAPLPGYGLRPGDGDDVDPRSLGLDLARDRLVGRSGLVLAGHSASCQVVVEAALAAPDAVVGLVLVGPTTDVAARSWPALASRWLRTAAHEPPGQVPLLVGSYGRVGPLHMLRAMDAARRHDVLAPLRAFGSRVLVLRGRHDRICPVGWADDVAWAAPPGSSVATLPAGGHMVPLTHGPRTAVVIRRFLQALAGAGA